MGKKKNQPSRNTVSSVPAPPLNLRLYDMVSPTQPRTPRFVVGVDFGTTFTSVAFAHSTSPEEVKLVQTWPNNSTGDSSADQVPTELHYISPRTRTCLWGYEIPKDVKDAPEPLKWFKLLLQQRAGRDYSAATSEPDELVQGLYSRLTFGQPSLSFRFTPPTITPAVRTKQKLREIGVEPAIAVSDFLAKVRALTVESISASYDKDFVASSKISYVLTIPAIWTDSAKDLMVQAAQRAGFGVHRVDFDLVSEPEAAAAYTLKAIQPHELRCGDTFIVCDAGGGTVDLISYKIENLIPLKIHESVSGSGDLCGSVFLDQRFETHIRRVLGDRTIDNMKPRSKREMLRTWEEKVKFKFGNSTDLGFEVTVPGVPDDETKKVEDGFHSMTTEDVKGIFDPVVDRVVELVRKQVIAVREKGEAVAAVLLVGGFGSSTYLLQRLKGANFGIQVQVIQPVNARSAIARGALLRGLDGSCVRDKRSRRYYGCSAGTAYEWGKGQEAHSYWQPAMDMHLTSGHMTWYVKKDTVFSDTKSISFPFVKHIAVPTLGEQLGLVFQSDLKACDLDVAPEFDWQTPEEVYRICTLTSDLSNVPLSKFKIRTNQEGDQYYSVNYNLKLTIDGEVLKFGLMFDGKSHGQVTAKFE